MSHGTDTSTADGAQQITLTTVANPRRVRIDTEPHPAVTPAERD